MTAPKDQLARIRQHLEAMRKLDPEVAEEGRDHRGSRALRERIDEGVSAGAGDPEIVEESIAMRRERPVLPITNNKVVLDFVDAEDSRIWGDRLVKARSVLDLRIPSVGRINLKNASMDWVGTGWLVREDTIVTNRHVAREFVQRGSDGLRYIVDVDGEISANVDFLKEIGNDGALVFELLEPLHIEPSPGPDVAFFKIKIVSGNARLARPISLATATEIRQTQNVATIGYPARDSRIPDRELMDSIYRGVYDKKRLAPGGISEIQDTLILHNCTTLGGNSGSAVIDLDSGKALGLHFSGKFLDTNYAVRADVVDNMLNGVGRERPTQRPTPRPAPVKPAPDGSNIGQPQRPSQAIEQSQSIVTTGISATADGTTITIPLRLNITVSVEAGATGVLIGTTKGTATPNQQRPIRPGPAFEDFIDEARADPADYDDRTGYAASFLGSRFAVPLPRVTRAAADIFEFEAKGKKETELRYEHYSVVMSRSRRMCFFSACNIDGEQSKKSARVAWKWDPRIPREQQIMQECYGNPPKFSRGHMTRREDPGWGPPETAQRGNEDSMHVTNVTPQMQAFNAPIWLALEDYALQHAREDKMRISVFTGPYFSDRDPTMYGVRIPVAFWKVIAFIHDDTGKLCATGYEMTQEGSLKPEEEFVFGAFQSPQLAIATQVSISSIEQRSGISFGNLADADPLATANESASEGATKPLLALEQIRFLGVGEGVSRPRNERVNASSAASVAREYNHEVLKSPAFSWPAALLLARASKLAYQEKAEVAAGVTGRWGFQAFEFIDIGNTQGFMAAAPGVTMVVFRGTESVGDWVTNLTLTKADWQPFGRVHAGFLGAYASVRKQVEAFVGRQGAGQLWIGGHSLGAALASIAAAELDSQKRVTCVCTFGQPRIGDTAVAQAFASRLSGRFRRFVNDDDIVTWLPPLFTHVGRLVWFDGAGEIIEEGLEAQAGAGKTEPEALTEPEFQRLQERMRAARTTLQTTGALEGRAGPKALDANLEGLIPGMSIRDHSMDRYVEAIARQIRM